MGGLIILDDFHIWDGCARALHDFLSRNQLADRIREWNGGDGRYGAAAVALAGFAGLAAG